MHLSPVHLVTTGPDPLEPELFQGEPEPFQAEPCVLAGLGVELMLAGLGVEQMCCNGEVGEIWPSMRHIVGGFSGVLVPLLL